MLKFRQGFLGLCPGLWVLGSGLTSPVSGGISRRRQSHLDNRLRVNIAAHDYDFTNVQVRALQAGSINLINGAKARVKGAELDAQVVATGKLTLLAGAAYASGEYESFPGAQFYEFLPSGATALSIGDAADASVGWTSMDGSRTRSLRTASVR